MGAVKLTHGSLLLGEYKLEGALRSIVAFERLNHSVGDPSTAEMGSGAVGGR